MSDKRTYNADKLIDTCATALVEGKGVFLRSSPLLGPVSVEDRRMLTRVTSLSIEAFNERLADKLGILAEKIVHRLEEKVDNDEIPAGQLAFAMCGVIDKRQLLEGRSSLQSASVNLTVNNFNSGSPKEAIIEALTGKTPQAITQPAIEAQTA